MLRSCSKRNHGQVQINPVIFSIAIFQVCFHFHPPFFLFRDDLGISLVLASAVVYVTARQNDRPITLSEAAAIFTVDLFALGRYLIARNCIRESRTNVFFFFLMNRSGL